MKNKWFVGRCVLLVFGFTLSGCDTGTGGGIGTGKKLTITGLPDAAVDKYVVARLSLGNGGGWVGRAMGNVNTSNIGDNTVMGAIVPASKQVTLNVYTHVQGNVIPYTGNEKVDANNISIYYEDNEECSFNGTLYPKGRAEEDADFADGDVTVTYHAGIWP
jgi:hypothetical protein